jgi:A/G-specific adenine glycosylase
VPAEVHGDADVEADVASHPLHAPVLEWYAASARDLPWRRPDCSPWGVFVSEIMAQQTPIARVLPAWLRWMDRWPTPAALAADSPGEAIREWARLGYPRRAVRLHEAAVAMVDRHAGAVPDDEIALRALPGVGEYTAAAVAAFAFGRRSCVVDTNVRRLLARSVCGQAYPAASLSAAERALAARLVPRDPATAATWAVASMELGALVCVARGPRCGSCPVRHLCTWYASGSPASDGPARRAQPYAGTDRYVRGLLLAVLRAAAGPVTRADLVGGVPEPAKDPGQRDRCLAALIEDGLVEPVDSGTAFTLPTC